jgi:hypothetical protein
MKSIAKILLVGAVAVTAIAISAAPSEAAKRKAKTATACIPATLCSAGPAAGVNRVNVCGTDSKWYQAVVTPTCAQPICPPKCG